MIDALYNKNTCKNLKQELIYKWNKSNVQESDEKTEAEKGLLIGIIKIKNLVKQKQEEIIW